MIRHLTFIIGLFALASNLRAKNITLDVSAEPTLLTLEDPLSASLLKSINETGDQLSITRESPKQGRCSLRWKWQSGDQLSFRIRPVTAGRIPGHSNINPAFYFWYRSPDIQAQPLMFQSDAAKAQSVAISLEDTGNWRSAIINCEHHLRIPPGNVTQTVTFTAPSAPSPKDPATPIEKLSGTLDLDLLSFEIQFTQHSDYPRPGQITEENAKSLELIQKVSSLYSAKQYIGKEVSNEELAAVRKIRQELILGSLPKRADLANAIEVKIQETQDIIEQRWLSGTNAVYGQRSAENSPHPAPGEISLGEFERFKGYITNLYRQCSDEPELRKKLHKPYLQLITFAIQQIGQRFSLSIGEILLMEEALQKHPAYGMLTNRAALQNAEVLSVHCNLENPRLPFNIEALGWGGGAYRSYVTALFLLRDDASIARALRTFKIATRNGITQPSWAAGYQDDGTIIHHGVPNWSYASYCLLGFTQQFHHLFAPYGLVDDHSRDHMRRVILRAEAYAAGGEIPFAIRARWLKSSYGINPQIYEFFGLQGGKGGGADRDVIGAYLNAVPDAAKKPPFDQLGISPRPTPPQTFAMQWSSLLTHRRDGFVATVKGANYQVAAFEMQEGTNRLARYLSHGFLQIANNPAGGDKFTYTGSGFSFAGLDWSHLPGTTTKPLPELELLANLGRSRGIETFAGGMAHQKKHGLYAMKLTDLIDRTFVARKSYFCFDDRILCLGSDIACADKEHPIHTTLFQKSLNSPEQAVFIDDAAITSSLPTKQNIAASNSPHVLVDPYSVAYLIPGGQAITLRRSRQVSHDGYGFKPEEIGVKSEKDHATAWLDHGNAPTNARYEYLVLPNRDHAAALAAARAPSPYRIHQQDTNAHIATDLPNGITAYALFEPNAELPAAAGPLKANDTPTLVMIQQEQDRLLVTQRDPIIKRHSNGDFINYLDVPTKLTLRGNWKLSKSDTKGTTLQQQNGETTLTIPNSNAAEAEFTLVK